MSNDNNELAQESINDERFNMKVVGWSFLIIELAMVLLFVYFVISVIPPMTQPSPYFQAISEKYASQKAAENNVDPLTLNFAVGLEYANANIRAFNVQVAFALIGGFFITVLGVLLFALQISDAIKGHVDASGVKFSLSTTAPGTAALFLGCVLMLAGILKPPSHKIDASMQRDGEAIVTNSTKELGSGSSESGVSFDIEPLADETSPEGENHASRDIDTDNV